MKDDNFPEYDDCAEFMDFINEQLKDDYEIIYIDRAGYGFSDDTSKTQTIEQILEKDYWEKLTDKKEEVKEEPKEENQFNNGFFIDLSFLDDEKQNNEE